MDRKYISSRIVQELDHIHSTLSQETQARVNLESQLEAALQKLTN